MTLFLVSATLMLLGAGVLPGALSPQGGTCPTAPRLVHLANMGVRIDGEAGSILLDAPFRERVDPFPVMESGLVEAAERAAPPFHRVRWILVSHAHRDHADAGSVARHLRNNPGARVASTAALLDAARAELPPRLHDRLHAHGGEDRWATVASGQWTIRVRPMSHGSNREVENLAFLLDVEGTRVLHVGDSEVLPEELRGLRLDTLGIDYAVLPGWNLFDGPWAGAIEAVAPGTVLLAHLPEPGYERGFVARHGGWDGVLSFLKEQDRPVIPLRTPGQMVCLQADK